MSYHAWWLSTPQKWLSTPQKSLSYFKHANVVVIACEWVQPEHYSVTFIHVSDFPGCSICCCSLWSLLHYWSRKVDKGGTIPVHLSLCHCHQYGMNPWRPLIHSCTVYNCTVYIYTVSISCCDAKWSSFGSSFLWTDVRLLDGAGHLWHYQNENLYSHDNRSSKVHLSHWLTPICLISSYVLHCSQKQWTHFTTLSLYSNM